jgi:hypothetical protein
MSKRMSVLWVQGLWFVCWRFFDGRGGGGVVVDKFNLKYSSNGPPPPPPGAPPPEEDKVKLKDSSIEDHSYKPKRTGIHYRLGRTKKEGEWEDLACLTPGFTQWSGSARARFSIVHLLWIYIGYLEHIPSICLISTLKMCAYSLSTWRILDNTPSTEQKKNVIESYQNGALGVWWKNTRWFR